MTTLVIPTEAPAVPGPPQGQWRYAAPHIYQEAESMSFASLPTINVSVGDQVAGAPDMAL